MPTVARILQLTPPSCYLSANRVAKGSLFGPPLDPKLPITIYMVYKILKRVYDLDPNYTGVREVADYLFELIQKYAFKAAAIVDGNNGGQIAPVTPGSGTAVNDIDFRVSATTYIATGESSVTFDGTDGNPDLRGYNIDFFRSGQPMYTTPTPDGSWYYAWNSVTGLFQLLGTNPQALFDEPFRISPDSTGGASSGSAYAPTTISLSADGTYTLPEGYLIWKISILPTAADTVKIGTTLAGDDIMFDKVMIPNEYSTNGTTVDVYAQSADKTIYFTGFTAQATINIYLLPIS